MFTPSPHYNRYKRQVSGNAVLALPHQSEGERTDYRGVAGGSRHDLVAVVVVAVHASGVRLPPGKSVLDTNFEQRSKLSSTDVEFYGENRFEHQELLFDLF